MHATRSRKDELAAGEAAYARIRSEADKQREKAAKMRSAEEIARDFELKEKEMGYIGGGACGARARGCGGWSHH